MTPSNSMQKDNTRRSNWGHLQKKKAAICSVYHSNNWHAVADRSQGNPKQAHVYGPKTVCQSHLYWWQCFHFLCWREMIISILSHILFLVSGSVYEGESITIRTVCFIFRKTRAEILQLHNISTQSPSFTMHAVHHCTICFMTSI
jgi:hypothetical protein